MENRYYLMWKNVVITLVQFDDNGKMTAYSKNISESAKELTPLMYRSTPDEWLNRWWDDRSVPVTRDQINSFLSLRGVSTPQQYLVKNLGLSLTDFYWLKPVNSNLSWEKINLFDNDFHDNVLISSKKPKEDGVFQYSPNASLQGNIEKTWTIVDGKRCLIKGNHSGASNESINEVIASQLHKKQGYDNYTDYNLIHIKGKPYKYGCISKAFTSQDLELVSAWSVITSEPMDNSTSYYEHFISVCQKHGIDADLLRRDLEYQIMSDYVLTNYDRHLSNISVLRDANTLKFIRMAPIYDSGDCLFANRAIPSNIKELQKMEITGFVKTENKLLTLVKDRSLIKTDKLPSSDYIKDMYHKDDKISDKHIDTITEWYERKKDILDKWQRGENAYNVQQTISQKLNSAKKRVPDQPGSGKYKNKETTLE